MKQILHVFTKDARHFWPEILISLALVAAFVWTYPSMWRLGGTYAVAGGNLLPALVESPILAMMLTMLLPVSWWLLIARVIHAEPLVGDRQFWLTRPYEWKKLLGAKLLFLLVFLYGPLLIAQCLLLMRAGFHPLAFIPGLLFNLLLLTGITVLPLFAITTVTATFARLTVTLLALLVVFLGYVLISIVISDNAALPEFSVTLSMALCGAVVLVQYASRRLRISLLLLIALPVLLLLRGLVISQAAAIQHDYAAEGQPVRLALLGDPSVPATADVLRTGQIQISIPLQASGVADGFAIIPDHVKVTVDAGNGRQWTSPWQAVSNEHYLPGTSASSVTAVLNRAFFDQVQTTPVTLHFTFAFTEVEAGAAQALPLSGHNFLVPGFGICSPQGDEIGHRFFGIGCRFALHQPGLTRISVLWPDANCSESQPVSNAGHLGDDWVGNLENTLADFSIPAVWSPQIGFSNGTEEKGGRSEARHLCPGTPVTFTPYHLVRRMHYDLTIPDFHLPSYEHDEASLSSEP